MEPESACTIYEDQQDYIEDIEEQLRDSIRRYTLYYKLFMEPHLWKFAKDDIKRFINYEMESCFSQKIVKQTKEGVINMRMEGDDD